MLSRQRGPACVLFRHYGNGANRTVSLLCAEVFYHQTDPADFSEGMFVSSTIGTYLSSTKYVGKMLTLTGIRV